MTKEEKLKELGYCTKYGNEEDTCCSYVRKSCKDSGICSVIIVKNNKPFSYYIDIGEFVKFQNIDTINKFADFIKEELEKVKKDFESLKEKTPKERVEEFLQECELYEEETNGSAEELPCYKTLIRDLEELERRRKSDMGGNEKTKFYKE